MGGRVQRRTSGSAFTVLPDDARCWLEVPGSGFPVTTLPLGVAVANGGRPFIATRVGDSVVDLSVLAAGGVLDDSPTELRRSLLLPVLNGLIDLGRDAWAALRRRLFELLTDHRAHHDTRLGSAVHQADRVRSLLPMVVTDFADFNGCIHHARRLAGILRGEADAPRHWYAQPLGYHGRAGTVVPSGTAVHRPRGHVASGEDGSPAAFGPTAALDFEIELGFVLGPSTALGHPVPMEAAHDHVFGVVVLNDWSARDIQAFESLPLGPFCGKSFLTTVSTWVVPLDALCHRFVPAPAQCPEPAPYLRTTARQNLDIELTVEVATRGQRSTTAVTRTNAKDMYWSFGQQLTQLTVNGASLSSGDLLGSGTVSGPSSVGSLIELTLNGAEPIEIEGGLRPFLADGDSVTLHGATTRADGEPVTVGTATGVIAPPADGDGPAEPFVGDAQRGVRR